MYVSAIMGDWRRLGFDVFVPCSLFQICIDAIMDDHPKEEKDKKGAGAIENSIMEVLKLALNLTHDFGKIFVLFSTPGNCLSGLELAVSQCSRQNEVIITKQIFIVFQKSQHQVFGLHLTGDQSPVISSTVFSYHSLWNSWPLLLHASCI